MNLSTTAHPNPPPYPPAILLPVDGVFGVRCGVGSESHSGCVVFKAFVPNHHKGGGVGQVLGLLVPVSSNLLPGFHFRPINPVVSLGALTLKVWDTSSRSELPA